MYSQAVVALLPLLCLLVSCEEININVEASLVDTGCGKHAVLGKDDVASIVGTGQMPILECEITINTTDCGICFMFDWLAYFNTTLVNLTVTVDSVVTFLTLEESFPMKPNCYNETSLTAKITHHSDYVYNATFPGYRFYLDVYNKCGYRGTAKSVPFKDVVKYAEGYHGEEKESRELKTKLQGLGAGLALSFILLVCFSVGYYFDKIRGASKSAEMPAGEENI